MAKNRRKRSASEKDDDELEQLLNSAEDPLGKLLQVYQVNLLGLLLIAGVILLIGLGLLAYATTLQKNSLIFLLIGSAVSLISLVLVGMNVLNFGRRLELRKLGVRFVEFGSSTELTWDQIADVEVNRTDRTNLGVATATRRSSDASSPSGLLTNSEWHVAILGHDGQSIHLRPMFLRTVADPKKLISSLRLRAGCR
ncbi:MAG: hypothetical protein JWM11_2996 [Planctomycetaceae bacterium]|nr:hypothetical protein [Planctomycetaceae bacterium]